ADLLVLHSGPPCVVHVAFATARNASTAYTGPSQGSGDAMETLLASLVFAAFLVAQVAAVVVVQGQGTGHGPHAGHKQAQWGRRARGAGVALAALLLAFGASAQDLNSVAQRFLERHGVPCHSVLKVGSPADLGEVATCDDGREWALFWLEDEIA